MGGGGGGTEAAVQGALHAVHSKNCLGKILFNCLHTKCCTVCAHVQLLHHMMREHVKVLYNRIGSSNQDLLG